MANYYYVDSTWFMKIKHKEPWSCDTLSDLVQNLYNLKNMKSTHGGVLLLIKLHALTCNFTKSDSPPWAFFTFFKLYKWYQLHKASHMVTLTLYITILSKSFHDTQIHTSCKILWKLLPLWSNRRSSLKWIIHLTKIWRQNWNPM